MRSCVLCRAKRPKRELLRLVLASDGSLTIDPGGRALGRGCYVCFDDKELRDRNANVKIGRALRLRSGVSPEFIQDVLAFVSANEGEDVSRAITR